MCPAVANSHIFQADEARLFEECSAARRHDKKEDNGMVNIPLMIMGCVRCGYQRRLISMGSGLSCHLSC
jgi:hypothetical protein